MKIVSVSKKITNHESAQNYILTMPSPESLSIEEVIYRVTLLNEGISKFWTSSDGWSPIVRNNAKIDKSNN